MATMTQAQILRTLTDLANFRGDEGMREAVYESLDAMDAEDNAGPGDAGDATSSTTTTDEGASSPAAFLGESAAAGDDDADEAPATGRRRSAT